MAAILGISLTHNGSVALIEDGEVIAAIQAERLSRIKRQRLVLGEDSKVAQQCVKYCLDSAGLEYSDINAIALSTPWNVRKIRHVDLFQYIGGTPENYIDTFYVPHHFSHMEYILHYGDFAPGIVLVIDGSGSIEEDRALFNIDEPKQSKMINFTNFAGKEVISAYWFDGNKSSLIYRFSPSQAPKDNPGANGLLQSIGHYWEWASQYCCGSKNEAGKVMGLAAFGKKYNSRSNPNLSINDEGEIKLNFDQLKSFYKTPNIFSSDLSNSSHHHNIAMQVQYETEEVILKLLDILKKKFPTNTLYLSGGVALNVVANEQIVNSKLFANIVLNGSVEDNGTAIGAALATNSKLGYKKRASKITDYYGKIYDEEEILEALKKFDFNYKMLKNAQVVELAATLISENNVIGWFQGRSEFGPRALGNRSILANPCSFSTKFILDHYMKCRDRYRPYAPVVIEEKAPRYFDIEGTSPVMMRNVKVLHKNLPAITHCDGTARVQTVNKDQNSILYDLLLEVEKKIGYPILLNTSFNLPGEPIVESPLDALSSFSNGYLDFLFLKNFLVKRS